MKKYLFALLLGGMILLALFTVAMADNGPHGGFTATTDACAGCHRAHTAAYGGNALLIADPEALCTSCHDGSGAATNVVDGVYTLTASPYGSTEGDDGGSLFGGGFDNALMATAWNGAYTADPGFDAVSRPTTSKHNVGLPGTIWGSGANNTANQSMLLECTSCHDPHGNAGWVVDPVGADVRVPSYRLLRWQPAGSDNGFTAPSTPVNWSGGAFPQNDAGTSGWLVPDNFAGNGNEWYTIGTANAFAVGDYSARTSTSSTTTVYTSGGKNYIPAAVNVAYFCAQCHDRYFNNSRLRNNGDSSVYCGEPGSASATLPDYPDADGVAPWIHPVDPVNCLPVTNSAGVLTAWGDAGPSGDSVYMYRHSSGDIRASMDGTVTAGSGASVSRSCVACHVAHGTAAQMTALADSASLAHGSTLLRMDNRTICLRCHATTVNFTVNP